MMFKALAKGHIGHFDFGRTPWYRHWLDRIPNMYAMVYTHDTNDNSKIVTDLQ